MQTKCTSSIRISLNNLVEHTSDFYPLGKFGAANQAVIKNSLELYRRYTAKKA